MKDIPPDIAVRLFERLLEPRELIVIVAREPQPVPMFWTDVNIIDEDIG